MKASKSSKFARDKNNKVALYLRANNADGIAKQLFLAIKYAQNNGIDISHSRIFADICSGNQYPRPAFDRLLREKRDKKYQTVLITSPDRLGRSPESVFMAHLELVSRGIELRVAV